MNYTRVGLLLVLLLINLAYLHADVCQYCQYCDRCDECPCVTITGEPNCEHCRYCNQCQLCGFCEALGMDKPKWGKDCMTCYLQEQFGFCELENVDKGDCYKKCGVCKPPLDPYMVMDTPANQTAKFGDNVSFACSIHYEEEAHDVSRDEPHQHNITWRRTQPHDDLLLSTSKYTIYKSQDETVKQLQQTMLIKNVSNTDSGRYSCNSFQQVEPSKTLYADLKVLDPVPTGGKSQPMRCHFTVVDSYFGVTSHTSDGRTCESWGGDYVQAMQNTGGTYWAQRIALIEGDIPTHNYCRNPSGRYSATTPWCYVREDDENKKKWAFCDVRECYGMD